MRSSAMLLGLVALVSACAGEVEPIGPGARPGARAETVLSRVTAHVAASLAHSDTRGRLIEAMAGSELPEKQLFLREYLESADGNWLLESVAGAAGVASASYLLTFPIDARVTIAVPMLRDRAGWVAQTQPTVAYAVSEVDPPMAIRADGSSALLSATVAPLDPLVLVRGGVLARVTGRNRLARTTRTVSDIGAPPMRISTDPVDCNDPTYIVPPPECTETSGGGWSWADFDRGVYMYDIAFDQTDEPYWDPNPEYDVMIYGRAAVAMNPYERILVSCSSWGTPKIPGQQFSVTNSTGIHLTPVRLFDGPTLEAFVQNSVDSVMTIEVVEDDRGESCKTETEGDVVAKLRAIIAGYQTADKLWKAGVKLGPPVSSSLTASEAAAGPAGNPAVTGGEIVAFGKAVLDFTNAVQKIVNAFTSDDFLGLAMTRASGVSDLRVTVIGPNGERGTAGIRIKTTPLGTP